MRTSHDETDEEDPTFYWWRSSPEFSNSDHRGLKPDLTKLTPRLKVLREMERLAMVAPDGLDEMRHKLVGYRAGDFWLPTGGMTKEDMVIPPVVTLLLVGLSGSGKSSLVNLMYTVLGRSGLIPFAHTSKGRTRSSHNNTTMYLEEHNVLRSMRSGFCIYDSRGVDVDEIRVGLADIFGWMSLGVRHYQPCLRPTDDHDLQLIMTPDGSSSSSSSPLLTSARFNSRTVDCVLVVANMDEIWTDLKTTGRHDSCRTLDATKQLFHSTAIRRHPNDNPILILTHGDKMTTEDRILGRIRICEYLGVSETTGAYDIACLTENGISPEESDPVTAFAVTEAIYRALIQSDRTYLPKRRAIDWILLWVSWIMCAISAFFASLAYIFSKMARKHRLKM